MFENNFAWKQNVWSLLMPPFGFACLTAIHSSRATTLTCSTYVIGCSCVLLLPPLVCAPLRANMKLCTLWNSIAHYEATTHRVAHFVTQRLCHTTPSNLCIQQSSFAPCHIEALPHHIIIVPSLVTFRNIEPPQAVNIKPDAFLTIDLQETDATSTRKS